MCTELRSLVMAVTGGFANSRDARRADISVRMCAVTLRCAVLRGEGSRVVCLCLCLCLSRSRYNCANVSRKCLEAEREEAKQVVPDLPQTGQMCKALLVGRTVDKDGRRWTQTHRCSLVHCFQEEGGGGGGEGLRHHSV